MTTATHATSIRTMTIRERLEAAIEGRHSRREVMVTLKRALRDLDSAARKVQAAEADRDRLSREASAARIEVADLKRQRRVLVETIEADAGALVRAKLGGAS